MNYKEPLVSVLIPTYNRPELVEKAILSAISQTYKNIEIIVSDDSTNNETAVLLGSLREKCSRLIYKKNPTPYGAARNFRACMEMARGEYVNFLMDDDLFHKEKIEKMVGIFTARPEVVLVTSIRNAIDEEGRVIGKYPGLEAFFDHDVIVDGKMVVDLCLSNVTNYLGEPTTVLFKRAELQEPFGVYGGRQYGCNVDMASWISLMERGSVGFLCHPLSDMRVHSNQQSHSAEMRLNGVSDWLHQISEAKHRGCLRKPEDYVSAVEKSTALIATVFRGVATERAGNLAVQSDLLEGFSQLWSEFGVAYQSASSDVSEDDVSASPAILKVGCAQLTGTEEKPQASDSVDGESVPVLVQRELTESMSALRRQEVHATFGFHIVTVPGTDDAARITLESLQQQWVPVGGELLALSGDRNPINQINEAISASDSEWVALINAGDQLTPNSTFTLLAAIRRHPEWRLLYSDEESITPAGDASPPHFKPDFNLDYLRSLPYVGGLLLIRRDLFKAIGGFDPSALGAEDYDLVLRAWEYLQKKGDGGASIGHVSEVLYRRMPGGGYAQQMALADTLNSAQNTLRRHFARLGVEVELEYGVLPATQRVRYLHSDTPMVSIIIPTRNQRSMLERCLESLFSHTAWPSYEVLVVDNGSDEADALQYLDGLRTLGADLSGRIQVLEYPQPFNYSAMNNFAARHARGEYLLLLNNDTAALHDDWLDVMMAHAQRPEVGVVGAKLLYPDGKVQHAGVVLGVKGPAEHPFIGREAKDAGYYARLQVDQNYCAVTGACLLVRKVLFDGVGGLDDDELAVSYSDIDLCLKIREQGKLVVWTPYALLLHEGSKSQKAGVESADAQAKAKRFEREQAVMYRRWMPQIANDSAYNRCLSLASTDFVEESDPALRWDPEWRPAPRIIAQPADRMGCGEYRIIAPARALINAGRVQGHEIDRIYTPPELARIKPDALILQRQVEPHQIDAIERHKRFNDVFCVFEIDDLVTNVPVKNAHKKHLPKDLYKRLRRAVGICDRLVVATEALAEAYSALSKDVKVIPNFIEDARWGSLRGGRRVGRKPRVGWAGGISHTGDLDLISSVVEELKDEVEWVFFGMCPERVRPYVHEFHEPVPIDQYALRLAGLNLDLAVAPLEDVPFNHAKSHLRLLEYGILGYPVVCSDLTPYRGDFPVTRVRNRHRDWVEAIRAHVSDLDATAEQGDALRKHVREHWLLENNLDAWLEGWLPQV